MKTPFSIKLETFRTVIENNKDLTIKELFNKLKNKDFSNLSFYNASFSYADFRGADFWGANFENANFEGASFEGADFRGADFWGTNFENASFSGANFEDADFSDVDFWGANFRRVNFSGANFEGANFRRANFEDADFRYIVGDENLIKSIQLDYKVVFIKSLNILCIGCKQMDKDKFLKLTDKEIKKIDGDKALEFSKKYKALIEEFIKEV